MKRVILHRHLEKTLQALDTVVVLARRLSDLFDGQLVCTACTSELERPRIVGAKCPICEPLFLGRRLDDVDLRSDELGSRGNWLRALRCPRPLEILLQCGYFGSIF